MRRTSVVIACVALLALLGGTGAVYLHDRDQSDRIAAGVTIGGVDIGGLSREQARVRLGHAVVEPLERPVVVTIPGGGHVRLSPERARLRLDVDAAVARAVRESRNGSVLERTWRDVMGDRLDLRLEPTLRFSRGAVRRTVRTVANRVDRAAANATVQPSGRRLRRLPGRYGRAVRRAALQRGIVRRLVHRGSDRFRAPVRRVAPAVTTRELRRRYPSYLVVDCKAFQLRYYRRLSLACSYRIAVGRQGLETPAGLYDIQSKQVNPAWHVPNSSWAGDLAGKTIPPGPRDPLKARWLGFNGSAGIHGTAEISSLGSAASHGCIRMAIPDVVALYRKVEAGYTGLRAVGARLRVFSESPPTLGSERR